LLDRGAPGDWDTSDARDVISAVERFYFGSGPVEPVVADVEVQQLAWHKMRSSFLLQNVSVDALAYVYEHTLVDDLTRQSLGTHSTPREIAEYIVRRLPFEDIAERSRTVFEPCAGHAVFLIAAMSRMRDLLPGNPDAEARHEYFVTMLAGMEIEPLRRYL
jgi:type I restriction-modification system DNA methylase subunit